MNEYIERCYWNGEYLFDLRRAARRLGAALEAAEKASNTARQDQIKTALHALACDAPFINFSHTVGTNVNIGRDLYRRAQRLYNVHRCAYATYPDGRIKIIADGLYPNANGD